MDKSGRVWLDEGRMKAKSISLLCVVMLLMGTFQTARAQEDKGAAIIVDVLVARPAGFAATVVGSVFFVVALPFAAMSKSVGPAAEHLVIKPAKATFTRPLGNFDALKE